jgi:hypothetical protein
MHTERRIRKDEADAFEDAVAALDSWTDEHKEPQVTFRGEGCAIGTVCNLVRLFSDPMPKGLYGMLYSLALQYYVEPPDDHSYASGAVCLRAVHTRYMASLRTRRETNSPGTDPAARPMAPS